MKKLASKLMLALICVASLSSCLGDSESSYEGQNEFAFIKSSEYGKYAVTKMAYVQHEDIADLSAGDCVIASYKLNLDNVTSSGYYQANYFDISQTFSRDSQIKAIDAETDTVPVLQNAFTVVNVAAYNPYQINFGDRWLMLFTFKALENEPNPTITFEYDSEMQVELDGTNVKDKSEKIVDIRLKRNMQGGTGSEKSKSMYAVVDFSYLRNLFESDMSSDDVVYPRFRYHKLNSAGDRATMTLAVKNTSQFLKYDTEE